MMLYQTTTTFSKKRLLSLLGRLKHQPTVLKEYDTTIRDQLRRGIIEVVDDSECQPVSMTHYISHHAVIRQDKEASKLRIASCMMPQPEMMVHR